MYVNVNVGKYTVRPMDAMGKAYYSISDDSPPQKKQIIYAKHKPQKHDECSQSCQVRPDHHEIWTPIQMVNISQTKKHRESPPSMATMVLVPFCGWLLLNDRSRRQLSWAEALWPTRKKELQDALHPKNPSECATSKTHAAKENWSTSLKWLTIMWITFDSSKDCQECNRPDPFDPATKLISSVVDMFPLDPSWFTKSEQALAHHLDKKTLGKQNTASIKQIEPHWSPLEKWPEADLA